MKTLAVILGDRDGIGPELVAAVVPSLAAALTPRRAALAPTATMVSRSDA